MESRFRLLFLNKHFSPALLFIAALGMCHGAVAADDVMVADEASFDEAIIAPQIERREVREADIDTEDFEIGVFAGLMSVEDFGVNAVIGVRLAYHVSEDVFVEAMYGQTDTEETSYERLSGGAQLMTDAERELSYYNVSIGYNVLPGESFIGQNRAYNTALYLIGGVGSTSFAGDDRFTINLGAGYRFLWTDWLALHLDVRDHVFDIDVTGDDKTTHNLETHGGITFFF